MSPACCYLSFAALAGHVSPHVSKHGGTSAVGSIWAADVPGWITAIATAVLAVFAIVTAIYAIRAFRKQSQEVSDQAEMLQVQSDRLELQERQFEDQRKINQKRDELFDKQLRESEQRTMVIERQQAEMIDLEPRFTEREVPGLDPATDDTAWTPDVANRSPRPIRTLPAGSRRRPALLCRRRASQAYTPSSRRAPSDPQVRSDER